MVDEVLRVHAELLVEEALVDLGDPGEVLHVVLEEPPRDAGADAPDVGDGAVVPDLAPELPLVEVPDVIVHVLGRHVERDLREEEVRSDPRRGADPAFFPDVVHELLGE